MKRKRKPKRKLPNKQAPNPGDLWWDGTQMRIWDGLQWWVLKKGPHGLWGGVMRIKYGLPPKPWELAEE